MPRSCCTSKPPPPTSEQTRRRVPTVQIGRRPVGAGQRAYVVAEAGVNHDGLRAAAMKLVEAAAAAGADAVKFQVFRAAELATPSASLAAYQQSTHSGSQREMLRRLELSDADLRAIRDHCRQHAVEFLATPFGLADVERLTRLGVRALKLASTDLDNVPLLGKAADTGLPLIVSTGAATLAEIEAAVACLGAHGATQRLILLHCVSCYPTPMEAANLRAIATLAQSFGVPSGFSDHTTAVETGAWAVAAGACVLEKHFTLDRTATGPDHAMSLDPSQLAAYIASVRHAESALGSGVLGMTPLEAEVRRVARKSVVAAAPLSAGTVLTDDMLTLKRPGGGIAPDQLATIVGRRLTTDVAANTILAWDMLA